MAGHHGNIAQDFYLARAAVTHREIKQIGRIRPDDVIDACAQLVAPGTLVLRFQVQVIGRKAGALIERLALGIAATAIAVLATVVTSAAVAPVTAAAACAASETTCGGGSSRLIGISNSRVRRISGGGGGVDARCGVPATAVAAFSAVSARPASQTLDETNAR